MTQAIVAGSLVTTLCAADPDIGKDAYNIPAVPLGDGFKLTLLVLDRLLCRGDAKLSAIRFRHYNHSVLPIQQTNFSIALLSIGHGDNSSQPEQCLVGSPLDFSSSQRFFRFIEQNLPRLRPTHFRQLLFISFPNEICP